MANTLTATAGATMSVVANDPDAPVTQTVTTTATGALTFASGSGAGKASKVMKVSGTLAQSASVQIDLVSTTFKDVLGNDAAFSVVRGVTVFNKGTASTLIMGGDAAGVPGLSGTDDNLVVAMAQSAALPSYGSVGTGSAAGYAVTATSADIIKLTHGGEDAADIDYEIVILGE